jgi:ribonucleotide reductase beta subunit family protein with ferritin-like domain
MIVQDAVAIECNSVRKSLPVALIGMNADLMCQYVEFCADRLLVDLGQPRLFNTKNPFEWMVTISLQGKTNFFEKRVGEYAKSGVCAL